MLTKIFDLIITFFFIPHYLIYRYSKRKDLLQEEFRYWCSVLPVDRGSERKNFFWYIKNLKEYRSVFYLRIQRRYSILLSLYAPGMTNLYFETQEIGKGLVIQHGHSTRINAAVIGERCQIWHNVTLGKNRSGGGQPKLGNNVKVYTGAVVLGDINIGDNAVIGALSVVLKDVPANCVVAGNPARIVKRDGQRVNEQL